MTSRTFHFMVMAVAAWMSSAPYTSATTYTSSSGHQYDASCNADCYKLSSKYPVSRAVGRGAGTHFVAGIEKIYLGRSCDAYSKLLGHGTWCWANGGFLAKFPHIQIGFPRQELYCAVNGTLGQRCGC